LAEVRSQRSEVRDTLAPLTLAFTQSERDCTLTLALSFTNSLSLWERVERSEGEGISLM